MNFDTFETMIDNTLGPDPSEEDTTPFDRTIEITVKVQRTFRTCNAGAQEDENRILQELHFDMQAAGYSKVDIRDHRTIDQV